MRTRIIVSLLIMTVLTAVFCLNEADAGFPAPPGLPGLPAPYVNVRVNGYLPAPPGVNVQIDSGRPYYMERDRRVYIEREPKHYKNKHYKKEKKHHNDNGNKYGHDMQERHGR